MHCTMSRSIGRSTRVVAANLVVAFFALGCSRNDSVVGPEVAELAYRVNAQKTIDPSQFQRVDRMGMPAIGTAVITSKDAYNLANPTDDAAGTFVDEIIANVGALHAALDDDLTGLGLTPCATGDCVGQAAPFVVPDVVSIDVGQAPGFPNGRRLQDPVIDVTLALVLLDLTQHPVTTLIGVNPTANDRPFLPNFPYVRPPHRGQGALNRPAF